MIKTANANSQHIVQSSKGFTMAANVDYNEVLVYMGDERERVPRDVVRARVHPSVTRISGEAFVDCIKLVEVELCEGLLEIGMGAFRGCNALKTINYHPQYELLMTCISLLSTTGGGEVL